VKQLNWSELKNLADRKATLQTKTGVPFQIIAMSEETLTVRVQSGEEHTISRKNLGKAVEKIQAGVVLSGPKDYCDQVADDRPAYAWAILKHFGYLE
jgi:hypothetical protein